MLPSKDPPLIIAKCMDRVSGNTCYVLGWCSTWYCTSDSLRAHLDNLALISLSFSSQPKALWSVIKVNLCPHMQHLNCLVPNITAQVLSLSWISSFQPHSCLFAKLIGLSTLPKSCVKMVETPMSLACTCSLYATFASMLHYASTLSELKVSFCF